MDLSLNLRGMVSQRLLPLKDARAGCRRSSPAQFSADRRSDLQGRDLEIKDLMKRSRELGMQTFDQSLFELYERADQLRGRVAQCRLDQRPASADQAEQPALGSRLVGGHPGASASSEASGNAKYRATHVGAGTVRQSPGFRRSENEKPVCAASVAVGEFGPGRVLDRPLENFSRQRPVRRLAGRAACSASAEGDPELLEHLLIRDSAVAIRLAAALRGLVQ